MSGNRNTKSRLNKVKAHIKLAFGLEIKPHKLEAVEGGYKVGLSYLDVGVDVVLRLLDILGDLPIVEIDLGDYNYDGFPEVLDTYTDLKRIRLTGNTIKGITKCTSLVKTLEEIDCWQISDQSQFPQDLSGFSNLQTLSVITRIDCDMSTTIFPSKLRSLNLQYFKLKNFTNVTSLSNLEVLQLTSGKIEEMSEGFCNLTELRGLVITGSHLQNIHCLNCFTKLEILKLSDNLLSSLPDMDNLSRLRILKLDSNRLSSLPKTISEFRQLEVFEIQKNRIGSIPAFSMGKIEKFIVDNNLLVSLPETFDTLNPDNFIRLDLSNNKLVSLPDSIGRLVKLEVLVLTNNRLYSLPDTMCNLVGLTQIWADHNDLRSLPENISNLKSLEKLKLVNNKLDQLPSSITDLSKLSYLSLENNNLKFLPDNFENFINLKYLSLNNNNLQELSHSLVVIYKNMEQKEINLKNNKIKTIPSSIGEISALENLILEKNEIESIPLNIFQLENLEKLYLEHNKITNLPEFSPEFSPSSVKLQEVNLSHNQIRKFGETFTLLINLERLYLKHNHITEIDENIGAMINLTELSLADNKIKKLPDSLFHLTNLEYLNLINNQLEYISDKISELTNLKTLYIENNLIEQLPENIGKLANLVTFDCQKNRIKRLPKSICNLQNLILLNLSSNMIKDLPEGFDKLSKNHNMSIDLSDNNIRIPDPPGFYSKINWDSITINWSTLVFPKNLGIKKLNLSHRKLTEFPKSLTNLIYLEELDLSHNNIKGLPDSIGSMKRLKKLDLSANHNLSDLPKSFKDLNSLQILDLSNTNLSNLPPSLYDLDLSEIIIGQTPIEHYPEHIGKLQLIPPFGTIKKKNITLKIVLAGNGAVGKTSLRNVYLGSQLKSYHMTLGADFATKSLIVDGKKINIQIWDLAGSMKFPNATQIYFLNISGLILVFDISRYLTFNAIPDWITEAIQNNNNKIVPMILVGNKSDLDDDRKIEREDAEEYAIKLSKWCGYHVPYVETSAKEGINVNLVFDELFRYSKHSHRRYKKLDQSSSTSPVI